MSEPQLETQEEREVREATEALAASKRKLALAEEARLSKAAADLAAHKIEQERQLHEAQLAREATEKKWAEEKQRKADALKAEQAAQEAHKAALESALAKEEEAKRQREAHTAHLAKIEAERFQAEQDAARIQRELTQAATPKEEPKPATLATNPLGTILGGPSAPQFAQNDGISSEQQAKIQSEKDRQFNVQSGRKSRPEVDHATSGDLEQMLRRELGLNPSTISLDKLSATFHYAALMTAARVAIAQFKARPMSCDALLNLIENLAEAPTAQTTLATPEQIAEQVSNAQAQHATAVETGAVGGANA